MSRVGVRERLQQLAEQLATPEAAIGGELVEACDLISAEPETNDLLSIDLHRKAPPTQVSGGAPARWWTR